MAQMSQSQLAREDRSTDLRMRRVGRRYCACAGRERGGGGAESAGGWSLRQRMRVRSQLFGVAEFQEREL